MAEPRPQPFLIADDLALDFLNSVAAPHGQPIEWLENGSDLVAWLEQAHAVPVTVVAQFRAEKTARALDAVASEARELRAWFRDFVRSHAGRPLGPRALRDLAPLNRLLERDESYRQVETSIAGGEGGRALRWEVKRRWHRPRDLLLPIAAAIGDLVCEKDFALVRKCEAANCSLWFLDVSKGHARRWCSMAVCGNRAKAAAHRARSRQGLAAPE